ncbi:MAG: CDP-alcohol phosphatidyltransferase family protein [Pirellulaceae bacterium]|nr:CDP-alcohol phosphatidyltransferase family protein [Pirellulaceae bacterium]
MNEFELETKKQRRRRILFGPRPRQQVYAVVPTLLTLGNAVCGFGAITFAAMVGPEDISGELLASTAGVTRSAGELLFVSAGLIFMAMVFDALDGSVARLTKQTSDFGAHLDSLCDVVSFGVAPAFLMLRLMHPDHRLIDSIARLPIEYPPRLLWSIAVMFMTCAILRLARFNNETDETDSHAYFKGLPSPAAAGVIAAFPIGLQGLKHLTGPVVITGPAALAGTKQASSNFLSHLAVLLPLITVCVAILMISRIRYPHIINQFLRGRGNRAKLLKILLALLLVFVFREMALPVVFCYYAFAAPIRIGWLKVWTKLRPQPPESAAG